MYKSFIIIQSELMLQTQKPLLQNQIDQFSAPAYNVSPEQDVRSSYAADTNPLYEKKQSYHVKALMASLIMWIGITVVIVLFFQKAIDVSTGGIVGICAGIYFVYLLLAMCCNPIFKYLQKIEHGSKFRDEYQRVKGLNGHFFFNAICYHYETRHHTRTVSDGNGGTKTQHYTTTQKVITHRASQNLFPFKTFDDSGSVDDVKAPTLMIFVHYLVNYRFVDENSRRFFDYQWYSFQNRNRYDAHQDYTYSYVVPGLIQRMTFFIGDKKPSWYAFLIIWSLIGLIWPYSMWVEAQISRYNIKFLKVLTMG